MKKRRSEIHPGGPEDRGAAGRQSDEWKERYMRALADYQNLEKRHLREQADKVRQANAGLLKRLIPIGDTLELAEKHISDPGLTIAVSEWAKLLADEGVTRISTVGKPFDPHLMECIEVVEGADGEVVGEVLPGYMLGEVLLRPAKVKVGKSTK